MSGGVGIILCGGQARRLGGISKADIMIGTQSCFQRTLACFDATFPVIAISGTSFSAPGYKSIPDWPSARRGGSAYAILGSLSWAALHGYEYMMNCPILSIRRSYRKAMLQLCPRSLNHNREIQSYVSLTTSSKGCMRFGPQPV